MMKRIELFLLVFFTGSLVCGALPAVRDDFGSRGRQIVHSRNLGIDAEAALDLEEGSTDEWRGGRGGRGRDCGRCDDGCNGFDGGGCGGSFSGCGGLGGFGFGGFWPWWGYGFYWPMLYTPWLF